MASLECPAGCGKAFNTVQACNSHVTQARSCQWYHGFEKSTALDKVLELNANVDHEELGSNYMQMEDEGDPEATDEQVGELLQEHEEENNFFHFVQLNPEPETVEVEHATGGTVIRMEQSLHDRWHHAHNLPIEDEPMEGPSAKAHLFAPFASEMDWRIAESVVKDNIGHNSFDCLLQIPGVQEKLGLSFSNIARLHKAVDAIQPCAGAWKDRPDKEFILCHRNILDVIKSLWGDPLLAEHLVYCPKSIFQDAQKKKRSYSEMWTGKWWQFTQNKLPKGATVAPLIIATDKTQLTQFLGSKQAYLVYLTLGNIPQGLWRKPSQQACVLLAYLPVDKISKEGLNKCEHSAHYQRLFHEAMRHIVAPLVEAGKTGIEMASADGAVHRVHPILASYIADFPEQCMVTCSKYGTCPKCQVTADHLGDPSSASPRSNAWTLGVMQTARETSSSPAEYFKACMKDEVSGYVHRPFWDDLPFADINFSITPDVLHQLYQGVLKHLISWYQDILGEQELDRRIRALPVAYGVRHFKNGILALSQISGIERKNMGRILLGCLVGSAMSNRGITAVRAILDFIYLAQYTTHDDDTLFYMTDALKIWHSNKSYFIQVGSRADFNIPKFHSLEHYVEAIHFLGATNNFNTEMFEHLHIDFAKKGWRASNKHDEFPQMTQWLSCQENIQTFNWELAWIKEQQSLTNTTSSDLPIQSDSLISQ
ncbi:hypothetical protein BT96DRAFT_947028 [Gymnopus androsaceus JB14]|uniref:C2H2-type domain-containing protein n=1 Tax=Gymnopus androsaceus JB14 TaxID=1447944 RepID=A0A6A4GTY4_9AGAR|nr:hypothetical protein BT96DRAFT_947028 [Gymnopus androsaceus JB14]